MNEYREKLITENMRLIKKIVFSLIKEFGISGNDLEDYLQEAYLAVFAKLDLYDAEKSFGAFARTIIKNRFIDIYRKRKIAINSVVYIEDYVLSDDEGNCSELEKFLKAPNSTENAALQNVTVDMLKKCISDVKRSCSAKTTVKGFEALELKMDGYTGEEIARMFNVPSNSLRSWMSKARKILINNESFIAAVSNL